MKEVTAVYVSGKLPSINEYIDACRKNKYLAAKMKKDAENLVMLQTLRLTQIRKRVFIRFTWYEENRRRDPDNVRAGAKFILDALQKNGKLKNDNSKWIAGFAGDIFVYGKGQGVLIEVIPAQDKR